MYTPSKHAGSDPEAFWLRPVMAVTASVQPESGRILSARSDLLHSIQFLLLFFSFSFFLFFLKKACIILYKTDLYPVWMAWSVFGETDIVWKQAGVQYLAGPRPVFHFQIRLQSSTDSPDNTVQNQPGSDLVLADCVRFWPNGSGPEASQCARIIRPASGQCFPTDPKPMPMGSGMFPGLLSGRNDDMLSEV